MVLCGIVLYNPDIERLINNISSAKNQTDKVLLIDNCSSNIDIIEKYYKNDNKIIIIKNESNMGIASALNQIVEFAKKRDYEWVLTLDQDSICDNNMVSNMMLYSDMDKIGILCPITLDKNNYTSDMNRNLQTSEMEWCITSGSLINVINTKMCKFDDKMFIDMVDYDFSLQVRNNGLKIIRVYNAVLFHRLGDLSIKKLFGKRIEITNHSPIRRYYYVRNSYYLINKWKYDIKSKKFLKKKIKKLFFKILLFENRKIAKIKMMKKGKKDSKRM